MSNVVYLHGQPAPVAQFLRIGNSGYRPLEQFLLAGQLPYRRFVVDAGVFNRQTDLISALQQDGRELVLDTDVAQLSVVGRYQGVAKGAPWADPNGMLTPTHFRIGNNEFDLAGKISRFVVQNGIKRVLAPAHLLSGSTDAWFSVDRAACEALRRELDRSGGQNVAIDYPLLTSSASFNDVAQRREFVKAVGSLPIDSIWLRISSFGSNATAAAVRKYISAARDFHPLGKPVISDCVGGLSASAILAFGGAGGIVHGVASQEQFNTSSWHKAPKPPDPDEKRGGNNRFFLLPGIDRLLKPEQVNILMEVAGGRRLLSCNDPRCCANGFEDTKRDPKGHYLRQRALQCDMISKVPEPRRVHDFVTNTLAGTDRLARQAAKLRVADSSVLDLLERNASRIDRLRAVLENLQETEENSTRSLAFPPPTAANMVRKRDRN